MGRIRLALAAQNFFGGEVRLPRDNPSLFQDEYDAFKPAFEIAAIWRNLGGMVDLSLDQKLQTGIGTAGEGTGAGNFAGDSADLLTAYGVEFRPIPQVGIKLERTWLEYFALGLRGYLLILEWYSVGLELDLSHDKFSGQDEERGTQYALWASLSY